MRGDMDTKIGAACAAMQADHFYQERAGPEGNDN